MNRNLKRRLCFILVAALLAALIPALPFTESASVYGASYDAFTRDVRWKDGTSWDAWKTPKLAEEDSYYYGCAAYCYDFAVYCFGLSDPTDGAAYYSASQIEAGDVITLGDPIDGTGHWIAVLDRSGSRLYTAEGNYSQRVRVGWNYTISGNGLREDSRPFNAGYHLAKAVATRADIAKASIWFPLTYYTGGAAYAVPKVVLGDRALQYGTDFNLTYADNYGVGTGKATITGIGKYRGRVTKTFPIAALTKVNRLCGANRYETAENIADTLKFDYGVGKFNCILVASGQNYPDALTGSYLAKLKKGPIVMVADADLIETRTALYIRENLKAGGTVYLLGGTGSITTRFQKRMAGYGYKVVRLGGSDRYATNLKILQEARVKKQELIICTGLDYPDALIASATGKPMMIVHKKGLSTAQKNYLKNNQISRITVIGDRAAVPESLVKQLQKYGKVTRVCGANKYETSVAVAKKYFKSPQMVMLAYADSYPDALAGGPLAIRRGVPLLLVNNAASQYKYAKSYVKAKGIRESLTLGGAALVSDKTVRTIVPQ